jgi:hypothetical protein
MTAETEYLIGEIHHLVSLRVHPLVIAEQLHRKPVSLYKMLLTQGDPFSELFSAYRSAPRRAVT